MLTFTSRGWEHYLFWQTQDKKTLKKINDLIKDIFRSPFEGIGHPEPLKHDYSGFWSRRITEEHRLVYRYKDGEVTILNCRYHYGT